MAFATADDVKTRLLRDALSTEESAAATAVISLVESLIAEVLGEGAEWVDGFGGSGEPVVPAAFKALCIEKAIGAIANPENVASISERLGEAEQSRTFPRAADISVFLSDADVRRVKRAYSGSTFKAVSLEGSYSGSVTDDLPDLTL